MNAKCCSPSTAYFGAAISYGAVRKMRQLRNATVVVRDVDWKPREVPMLVGTKVGLTVFGALSSPYLLPMYIYNDVCDFEVHVRALEGYGHTRPKTSALDYFMA